MFVVAYCQLRFYHFSGLDMKPMDAYNPVHLQRREVKPKEHLDELMFQEKLIELQIKVRFELFIYYLENKRLSVVRFSLRSNNVHKINLLYIYKHVGMFSFIVGRFCITD